jgi:hypothetical protein
MAFLCRSRVSVVRTVVRTVVRMLPNTSKKYAEKAKVLMATHLTYSVVCNVAPHMLDVLDVR